MIEEKLVTPPVRTAVVEEKTPSRDWWLHWNALTLRANQSAAEIDQLETRVEELGSAIDTVDDIAAGLLSAGTHAERMATVPDPEGALFMETDRNNIVYQAREVAGARTWVYVTGAMYGTVIAVDQRPTGLGANDTGLLFLSRDSTSVRWNGGSWDALDRVLDLGPAPPNSQLVVKANAAGAFSVLAYSANNINLGLDVEFAGSGWVARDATCAWIRKSGGALQISRASGATPGGATSPVDVMTLNLATGAVVFQNGVAILGAINTASVYQVFGNQVVGGRLAGIVAPAGGTVVDVQARAAIQSLINALSFAAGGHGLIA